LQVSIDKCRGPFDGNVIPAVEAAPITLTGNITISELIVEDGQSVIVSGSTIILTGNITVKDQGQLFVLKSRLQLSIRGERTYNVSIRNSASMIMQGSVLEGLSGASYMTLSEDASLTLVDSQVTGFSQLRSIGASTFTAQGSTLNVGYAILAGKSVSIIGTSMPKGRLEIYATSTELVEFKGNQVFMNSSRSVLDKLECNALELHSVNLMHVNNTKAGTAVFDSRQKVVVTDSIFGSLTYLSSGIATNVTVTVKGTQARAGGPIYAVFNTTVLRYWYLKVNVTDLAGTGIPAQIVVTDYLNKTAAIEKADVDGIALRAFPAEIINGTRTTFTGNYRIRATYMNYATGEYPVTLDGNKVVRVKFIESVPIITTTKLTLSTMKINTGDKVGFEGSINPGKPDEFVEVFAIGPGDVKIQQAFKTDKNGDFKGEYTLQTEGQWYFYADWLGGASQGISTKSQAFIVRVDPRPPITLLLLRALPIIVVVLGLMIGIAVLALSRRKKAKM
jgi:hypothetical protein